MIVFDIDITDDMIARISKITGTPVDKINKDLTTIISKIENQE
ncbi:hypothetical protein ES703_50505 [subsurface metagenome]